MLAVSLVRMTYKACGRNAMVLKMDAPYPIRDTIIVLPVCTLRCAVHDKTKYTDLFSHMFMIDRSVIFI
jgi:hypothetical protein